MDIEILCVSLCVFQKENTQIRLEFHHNLYQDTADDRSDDRSNEALLYLVLFLHLKKYNQS